MTWQKVPGAAKHMGLSVRTTREMLKFGLPHSRLPSGTILIELEKADEWLRGFDVDQTNHRIVNDLIKNLKS